MWGHGSMCDNTSPARDKQGNLVCDRAGSTNMPLGTLWVTTQSKIIHSNSKKLELGVIFGLGPRKHVRNSLPARDKGGNLVCDRAGSTNMPHGTFPITILLVFIIIVVGDALNLRSSSIVLHTCIGSTVSRMMKRPGWAMMRCG